MWLWLSEMDHYRINKRISTNPGGFNEIHSNDCIHYVALISFEDLGVHEDSNSAKKEARARGYMKATGCRVCSREIRDHK